MINPAPLNSTNSAGNTVYRYCSKHVRSAAPPRSDFQGMKPMYYACTAAPPTGRATAATSSSAAAAPAPKAPPCSGNPSKHILRPNSTGRVPNTLAAACMRTLRCSCSNHTEVLGQYVPQKLPWGMCMDVSGRYILTADMPACCRYGFDTAGKLPAQPSAQAQDLVGVFNNRASNPVIQAAAKDATEAILWEVGPLALSCMLQAPRLQPLYCSAR